MTLRNNWVKNIGLHSPDFVESLAEKVGRLNDNVKEDSKD